MVYDKNDVLYTCCRLCSRESDIDCASCRRERIYSLESVMAIDVLESSVELSFELTLLIQVSLSSTVANCWPRPCLAKSSERRCSHAFSLHRTYTTQTSTHSIYAQYVCTKIYNGPGANRSAGSPPDIELFLLRLLLGVAWQNSVQLFLPLLNSLLQLGQLLLTLLLQRHTHTHLPYTSHHAVANIKPCHGYIFQHISLMQLAAVRTAYTE